MVTSTAMRGALALLLMALGLACDNAGEPDRSFASHELEERIEAAIADADIGRALALIEHLQEQLPEAPESVIRVAHLLGRAGEMSRAMGLLQDATVRYPSSQEIKLGLAETAIVVGSSARALEVLESIPEDDSRDAYATLLRSRALLNLGDLEAALSTLEEALERHPGNLELGMSLIQGLIDEKQHERALQRTREMLPREAPGSEGRSWLEVTEATLMAALGEGDLAVERLQALVARQPDNVAAWQRLTELLIRQGDALRASELLSQALERRPDEVALHPILAFAEMARGDTPAATATLRKWVERDSTPKALLTLAKHLYDIGMPSEGALVLEGADQQKSGAVAADLAYFQVAILLGAARVEEARRHFERFQGRFPRDPGVEYLRARFELIDGDAAAAVARLKRAVARLDRSDVQHWLGVAHETLGDDLAAEYRYGLAIERDSRQIVSYLGLLRMLERRGAWHDMAAYARILVRVAPYEAAGYDALARALLAQGKSGEAEQALRTYVQRFPQLAGPVVVLSAALRQQARLEEALAELDDAIPRFPSEPRLLAERAIVLGQLGRTEEALSEVERALETGAQHADLHRARAYLLFVSGRTPGAMLAVEESVRLAPHDPTPLQMLGDHLSMRGDFAGARRAYERYLESRPKDAAVLLRLAAALARLEEIEEAVKVYRRVIEVNDESVQARNNLAILLQQQGKLDEALVAAQAAYARAEREPVVMDTLGWLYLHKGREQRAVALLSAARDLAPASVETRYHLAMAYRQVGRLSDARELCNELHRELEESHELYARVDDLAATLR